MSKKQLRRSLRKKARNVPIILLLLLLAAGIALLCFESQPSGTNEKCMNPNEASVSNSIYTDSREDRGVAWGVVQARFWDPTNAVGGFCGTAWFLEQMQDKLIFVTAGHVVGDALFCPKDKRIVRTLVWLANGTVTIPITLENRLNAANDISFLVVPATALQRNQTILLPRVNTSPGLVGGRVFNLGYPARENDFAGLGVGTVGGAASVRFSKGPWRQIGRVCAEHLRTESAPDVQLVDADALILDYASEPGFSGGPLLRGNGNSSDVVGMMVSVVANGSSAPTQSVAVSVREVLAQKKRVLP